MYQHQHMRELVNRLTLIGSRAWGGYSDCSDYDFIASNKIESTVFDIMYELDINFTSNTGYEGESILFNEKSVKFILDNKVVNILFYKDEDYPKIDLVANMMLSLSKTKHFDKAIENKNKRHRLFEKLVETVFANKDHLCMKE